ncbi:unnamed protein product [Urochloa humidicola]
MTTCSTYAMPSSTPTRRRESWRQMARTPNLGPTRHGGAASLELSAALPLLLWRGRGERRPEKGRGVEQQGRWAALLPPTLTLLPPTCSVSSLGSSSSSMRSLLSNEVGCSRRPKMEQSGPGGGLELVLASRVAPSSPSTPGSSVDGQPLSPTSSANELRGARATSRSGGARVLLFSSSGATVGGSPHTTSVDSG